MLLSIVPGLNQLCPTKMLYWAKIMSLSSWGLYIKDSVLF